MITEKQLIELHNKGTVSKFESFYYVLIDTIPTYSDIMKANSLQIALSEWMEIYYIRYGKLVKKGIPYGVPIISEEECYAMGL